MDDQQRLIQIVTEFKGFPGTEGWSHRLITGPEGLQVIHKDMPADYWFEYRKLDDGGVVPAQISVVRHGPTLPHDPFDPMNPSACLERAGAYMVSDELCTHGTSAVLVDHFAEFPTYIDYMEALLELAKKAVAEGGEWMMAWLRAMTPEPKTIPQVRSI